MTIKRYTSRQALKNEGFRQLPGRNLTLAGNNLIASTGSLEYEVDKSTEYVARSVVDAEYVTGITSNIILTGDEPQVIFRGVDGIAGATGFTYDISTSGVTAPNLFISQIPPDAGRSGVGDEFLLTWDDGTLQVAKTPIGEAVGLQEARNGLTAVGTVVELGGTLCRQTIICGDDDYELNFRNLAGMCIGTTEDDIVLDARSGTGGLYLKSQCGTINTESDFTNAVGIAIDIQENRLKIYDNRTPSLRRGIEYDADYSATFSSRSLVDREYVDAIASGLQPKQAVDAATTEGETVDLSATGVTGATIDGVQIVEGDRVLIKNQLDAVQNGIYEITGGTWQRTEDFDEDEEVVRGAFTFVISGDTNASTTWVLTTADPISVDVTPLTFTQFNVITAIVGGHGIKVINNVGEHIISVDGESLAGNSIIWSGATGEETFNVDVNSGTLADKFDEYLPLTGGTVCGDLTVTGLTNTESYYQISGYTALQFANNDITNIAIGPDVLTGTTGTYNVGIGKSTLQANVDGDQNIAIGVLSSLCGVSGDQNIAIGQSSLHHNLDGSKNTIIGAFGFWCQTTSESNIGIGSCVGYCKTGGDNNIFIGNCAGAETGSASGNVYIGNYVGCGDTSSDKLLIGNSETNLILCGDFTTNALSTTGQLSVGDIPSTTATTNCYLVADDDVISFRTCDELLSDLGIEPQNTVNVISVTGITYNATQEDSFIGVSGGTTVNLPSTPLMGQKIIVADIEGDAFSNPITVYGNGNNILDDTFGIINTDFGSVTLVFNANEFWSVVGFNN